MPLYVFRRKATISQWKENSERLKTVLLLSWNQWCWRFLVLHFDAGSLIAIRRFSTSEFNKNHHRGRFFGETLWLIKMLCCLRFDLASHNIAYSFYHVIKTSQWEREQKKSLSSLGLHTSLSQLYHVHETLLHLHNSFLSFKAASLVHAVTFFAIVFNINHDDGELVSVCLKKLNK